MAIPDKLKELVAQLPDPDGRGMYCENIDKEKIERVIAEIHRGGREFVAGLVEMLGAPGSAEDVKPHYALHCLANHVLILKDENARRQFCEVLCEKLGTDLSAYNKGYLCQELQWAGRAESCAALGRLLTDEELCEPAAMALVAIRQGAAEQFRAALPKAQGKCRLNVIHGLAALADGPSAAALRAALEDADSDVRICAGYGLAKIADSGAIDALLKAADGAQGWERIQQTKSCLVLAERLAAAGKKDDARRIYARLRDARNDASEKYIKEAAEKALAAL